MWTTFCPMKPAIDETFTMLPPPETRGGAKAWGVWGAS
jgi:hypothetical protein